jgi:hypothetical protein
MARLERADDLDQPRSRGDAGEEADAERGLVRGALEGGDQALVRGRDLGEEALARRGERDAPARAVDQALPELGLQRAEALAHARLRDPEPLGGAPEVELLGEGEEDPDLAELDGLPHR